jgi:ADP-heptose:LPS heptosyltransferase
VFQCLCPQRKPEGKDFDEVTLLDCQECVYKTTTGEVQMENTLLAAPSEILPEQAAPSPIVSMATAVPKPHARKLILHTGLPIGDALTLTAAVHCLHEQYPGEYLTAASTPSCPAIWENNPNVVPAGPDFETLDMHYHTVNESNQRPIHFIQGYTDFLSDSLKRPIKMTTNRPHLFISDEEKKWMNQVWEVTGANTPYWIINSGVKADYPAKQYPFFQEVVDRLAGLVRFAQIGKTSDIHKPLRGVINLLDKTSDRALIRLAYWAQGVLCGVTCLMHMAAAFEKPAVILAGGREPRLWNSYPTMTLLSAVGALDCCRTGGCWISRVVPLGDGKDGTTCKRPMPTEPPAGECMTRISPEMVARAVESYLP